MGTKKYKRPPYMFRPVYVSKCHSKRKKKNKAEQKMCKRAPNQPSIPVKGNIAQLLVYPAVGLYTSISYKAFLKILWKTLQASKAQQYLT